MHLGLGEEAVMAAVASQLIPGDALALDHRGTAALVMSGLDRRLLLREFLGRPDGLCHGRGGHMHLFSREPLAASSGIVGASGPAAAGFALAARRLRPGTLAVAYFGDGAMNQGMLLESFNLAAAWRLPVLFVCKDDGWAITTRSESVTGGSLLDRARGFGLSAGSADGLEAEDVRDAVRPMIDRARSGGGPSFLHARCVHIEGHFLGDPLGRLGRRPVAELKAQAGPMIRSMLSSDGGSAGERLRGLARVAGLIARRAKDFRFGMDDPVSRARKKLGNDPARLEDLEARLEEENNQAVEAGLAPGIEGA
jgi:pyruvate dehydrogenase E1 component alpha subunit